MYLGTAALALILTQAIAACTAVPRDQLLTALAAKAGCTAEFVNQVLAGAAVPLTAAQLEAFATELQLDPLIVKSAAAADPDHVRRTERERLDAIDAIALPGHRELVARLKASGATVEQAALQLCQAERQRLATARAEGLRDRQLDEAELDIEPAPRGADPGTQDDREMAAAVDRALEARWAARGLKRPTSATR